MTNKYLNAGIKCGASLLCVAVLAGFSPKAEAFQFNPFNQAQSLAVNGNQLFAQGRYEDAFRLYKQVAETELNDRTLIGLSLSNAGECLRKLKRYQEAKQYFAKAYPILEHAPGGVGNANVNTLLARWGIVHLAENNYGQAEARFKQCLDNSLGIWTYNYSDLGRSTMFTQILMVVADSRDGSGERWYQYGKQELARLAMSGGAQGAVAYACLDKLEKFKARYRPVRAARSQTQPFYPPYRGRDQYFVPRNNWQPHRARYGMGGTETLFQRHPWR